MKYGPLPRFCIERLREKLNEAGHEPEIFTDDNVPEQIVAINTERVPTSHPTYRDPLNHLHIEIPDEHLHLVKDELEKMGISFVDPNFDPGFEEAELEKAHGTAGPVLEQAGMGGGGWLFVVGLSAAIAYLLWGYLAG